MYNNFNLYSDESISFDNLIKVIQYEYEIMFKKKLLISVKNDYSLNIQKMNYSNLRLKSLGFNQEMTIQNGVKKIFQYLLNESRKS